MNEPHATDTPAERSAAADAAGKEDALRRRAHNPGFVLDCGADISVRHVGIVFVHGIGSQNAGETLLDWGGKIISLLLDTRVADHASGDPVIACELDPGPSERATSSSCCRRRSSGTGRSSRSSTG